MADKAQQGLMRDPDGHVWEERGGKWYEVSRERAGGAMAAQGMGLGESILVGAGSALTRMGRNAWGLLAGLAGDDAVSEANQAREREAQAHLSGARDMGKGLGLAVGEALPGLATLPLGLGVGGAAARGARALADQVGIGAAMGGLSSSGDSGLDTMVGGLLGAAGFGTGALAGRVVGAIRERGVAARAAVMEAASAAREAAAPAAGVGQGAAAGGAAGGGAVAGELPDALHLGAATGPVGERIAAGESLPGMLSGAPGAAGLTEEKARLAGRARELGMELTPGQQAGNKAQQQLEASAQSSPWSSMMFEPLKRNNEAVLNRLGVEAIGEEGTALTQQVLNNAHTRLGRVFDHVGDIVGTIKGDALDIPNRKLATIIDQASTGGAVVPEVAKSAQGLASVWDAGSVTGERLMYERSRLVQRAREYSRNGMGLAAQGTHDVIGVIDNMLERAAGDFSAPMRETLREARAQWRVLSTLESGAAIRPDGGIRSGAFYQALTREFPLEMRRGNFASVFGSTGTGAAGRDLMDAVRVTQVFRDVVSDSGTATRLSLQGLLGSPLKALMEAAIVSGGSRLYLGGGGQLAREVAAARNAAPAAGAALGGAARGGASSLLGGPSVEY